MRTSVGALVAMMLASVGSAFGQTAGPISAPVGEAAPPARTTIRVPAGTVVVVELTEALSSETSQQEQTFGLRLVEPIIIDGREVVPAGTLGGGEVIDAARSSFGGRQGRLIISGRYLEIGGQRTRIRTMQLSAVGEDRANTALGVAMIPYAGVAAIFIQGGEIEIPVGARGTARLATDIDVPLEAAVATQIETTAPIEADAPVEAQAN